MEPADLLIKDLISLGFDVLRYESIHDLAHTFGSINAIINVTNRELDRVIGMGCKGKRCFIDILNAPDFTNRVRLLKNSGVLKTEISDEHLDEHDHVIALLTYPVNCRELIDFVRDRDRRTTDTFVTALNIPGVNECHQVDVYFPTFDALLLATENDLLVMPYMGKITSKRLFNGLHSNRVYQIVKRFKDENIIDVEDTTLSTLESTIIAHG